MKVNQLVYISMNKNDIDTLVEALNHCADKLDVEYKGSGDSVDLEYSEVLKDLADEINERMMEG